MTWLITGGAGYIGSHVVRAFTEAGREIAVYDSLISGHREFVSPEIDFIQGDVRDYETLSRTFKDRNITGVIHLAGYKYAGLSVDEPLVAYDHNVNGTMALLRAMHDNSVSAMVFSSSAAVYGTPQTDTVTEDSPTFPESPYGESKLVAEWLIAAQARATGLKHTSLRYFNVVGSGYPDLYDTSPYNLYPRVLEAIKSGNPPQIFGDDYPTPDGTCVRDYVHVQDLAHSHLIAAQALESGTALREIYNLGSGAGHSVLEMVSTLLHASGNTTKPVITARRPGDPARIVANGERAARELDWQMRYTTEEMANSAWQAYITSSGA